ncbi:hypothetical protein EDF68_10984 [Ochrobactrum sp. BH3]|nr:hypothetical protein EDF68_10984 [Ochrobactrum sp. BH3]
MSTLTLSRYLPDFSTHPIADDAVEIIAAPAHPLPLSEHPKRADAPETSAAEKAAFTEQAEVAHAIAVEEEKRNAFEAGREDGHKEAEALYEAEKARLLHEHEAEIEALRASFSREQAILLAGALTEALSGLEKSLSAQIADVLAPLLAAKLERDAVSGFAQRISTLALEARAPEIAGPLHLLEPLREHADLLPAGCRFTETTSGELSFSFGERVLETRVAPVLEELRAAAR